MSWSKYPEISSGPGNSLKPLQNSTVSSANNYRELQSPYTLSLWVLAVWSMLRILLSLLNSWVLMTKGLRSSLSSFMSILYSMPTSLLALGVLLNWLTITSATMVWIRVLLAILLNPIDFFVLSFGGGDSRCFGPRSLLFLNSCRECFHCLRSFFFFFPSWQ